MQSSEPTSSSSGATPQDVYRALYPFLHGSNLQLNLQHIRNSLEEGDPVAALSLNTQILPDSCVVTNGHIRDIYKFVEPLKLTQQKLLLILGHVFPTLAKEHFANMDVLRTKLQTFNKKLSSKTKSKSRDPTTYSDFLLEVFDTDVREKYTPRKSKLREANRKLSKSKKSLSDEMDRLQKQKDFGYAARDYKLKELAESNAQLITSIDENTEELQRQTTISELLSKQIDEQIVELDAQAHQIEEHQDKIVEYDDRLHHMNVLKKKVAGLKSAYTRKRSRDSTPSPMSSPPPSPPIMRSPELHRAVEAKKDIVVVGKKVSDNVFEGKTYFGDPTRRKSTSGHSKIFMEIDTDKPCSSVGVREVQKRATMLNEVAGYIAGGSEDDKRSLFIQLVRSHKQSFQDILTCAGFKLQEKMSPSYGLQIQSLLRLSTYGFRNLRKALTNLQMNILPSEGAMGNVKKPLVSHVSSENVESGTMALRKMQKDEKLSSCAFVRVKSLVDFISHIISNDSAGFREDAGFENKWWLIFGGDKGGSHMKFHVEVVNSNTSGSVDNVHLYTLYEAADSPENMWKVWLPFRSQIKVMMEAGYELLGREIMIFLGGDYHYLDDMLGHQGSSASYPSHLDYVALQHLQNHGGKGHTPDNCGIPLRTIAEYSDYYNGNLADTRNGGDMRVNGKNYYSVVDQMIFPLNTLCNVVPATLHIELGITLLLYNLILSVCKSMDELDPDYSTDSTEKEKLDSEYEIASVDVKDLKEELHVHGVDVVTMMNRLSRFEALTRKDLKENKKIAKMGGLVRRRERKQVVEKCCIGEESGDQLCFITEFDTNVNMVQCDGCKKWYHAMCESVVPSAEVTLSDIDYFCLSCSSSDDNPLDRRAVFEKKLAVLIMEEDTINCNVVDAALRADELKVKYTETVGKKEKELVDALEKMKVERQAYHGNVMVGNHCEKVLEKHSELTKVIEEHDRYDSFNKVFSLFNSAMKLMMTRRFLSDDEILTLTSLCYEFGAIFPVLFPERNVTRKIHEFVFNVPKFVQKHKTIGLLSEQEGESKHSSVKAELRSLASVRDHGDRMRLVMEKEELRSYVDKSIAAPIPKMCQNCRPDRVFLRAGNDKNKHCKICEPQYF